MSSTRSPLALAVPTCWRRSLLGSRGSRSRSSATQRSRLSTAEPTVKACMPNSMTVPAPLPAGAAAPGAADAAARLAAAAVARLASHSGLPLPLGLGLPGPMAPASADSGVPGSAGVLGSTGEHSSEGTPEEARGAAIARGMLSAGESARLPVPEVAPEPRASGAAGVAAATVGEPTAVLTPLAAVAAAVASSVCTVMRKWPCRQAAWKICIALACSGVRGLHGRCWVLAV